MKHSIFWKLVLIMLPLVLVADTIVLTAAYIITYEATMANCRENVNQSAVIAAQNFELADIKSEEDLKMFNDNFDELCEMMGMVYIYSEKPDPEKGCKTYLSIGFGKDASASAKESHHIGYVSDVLYDEEIQALRENKTTYRMENNQYGHTIICFTPVKRHPVTYSLDDDDESPEGEALYFGATELKDETISIVGAEMSVEDAVGSVRTKFRFIMLFIFSSSVLIVLIISLIIKKRIAKPVRLISQKMSDFVHDRKNEFEPLKIKGNDEFAKMADAFNSMASEIDHYIDDISQLNREKAMQETELNIAREIQSGFLEPSSFHNDSVDICACMHPAKDVGGDLYDYRILNDGNVCVIIADVSGKGVSAALFMTNAITMLRQFAEAGLSPAKMMSEYNDHLARHNPNMMFITTFIGIYHPDTGELVYSNAGHNPPYILSDSLVEVESMYEAAAGLFEDEPYTERSITMKPGDTLFLYTDGVTEAKSTDNTLFGDDRLKEKLSENLHCSGEEVLNAALGSVKAFSENAEQSDDITILTMTVPKVRQVSVKLEARAENLSILNEKLFALDITDDDKNALRLIIEEMFVNICSYAYKDGKGDAELIIEQGSKSITLTFIDSGEPFDPTSDVLDINDYDIDNDIGGLGRFLTFEIADEYSYQYKDGKNILTVTKNISSDSK